ncbi:MAG TPA: fumarylacetoacetase, partial [Saprospiraceae bacterium]|nr:fumarylacetoacetase [Saprospiraceae bacterium]
MIKANNPKITSWVEVPKNSDFPIQNLPFGVFKTSTAKSHLCSRIGDYIVDLYALANLGLLKGVGIKKKVYKSKTLNKLIGQGKRKGRALRERLSDILN